jgi:hypothetical protein
MTDATSIGGSGDGGASLATLKGIAQTIGQLVPASQRQGFTIGTVLAVNNIGTSSIQVLAAPNPAITWLVFHNPSNTVELLVQFASLGAASFSARGGAFLLLPGDYLPLSGAVSFAWNGIAQSGTNNPLTIVTSQQ